VSDIVDIIRSAIVINPHVRALVESRIYPDELPQNAAMPSVVLSEVDGLGVMNLKGVSGVRITRIQVDCFGNRRSDVNAIDEQIRLAVLRHPASTYVDPTIDRIMDDGHRDLPSDAPRDGSQSWRKRRQHDYLVTHDEEIP